MKNGSNSNNRILIYFINILIGIIMAKTEINTQNKRDQATFGAGCFWCVEAVFEGLEGVLDVRAGYAGGSTKNPTYEEICTGITGHAEVIQIDYNPSIISYKKLLDIFWKSHDPTTLNKQGADIGTQYRSVVFYQNEIQKESAEKSMRKIDNSDDYKNPIVTEIRHLDIFYLAENYHQDYFRINPNAPYCQLVIKPKLATLNKEIN